MQLSTPTLTVPPVLSPDDVIDIYKSTFYLLSEFGEGDDNYHNPDDPIGQPWVSDQTWIVNVMSDLYCYEERLIEEILYVIDAAIEEVDNIKSESDMCRHCGSRDDFEIITIDEGIGSYEFWGAPGYQTCLVEVCSYCEYGVES